MSCICFVLWIKLRLQYAAHTRRIALAKDVHALLNDKNAPVELVNFGLSAIDAAFNMGLLRKAFRCYRKGTIGMDIHTPAGYKAEYKTRYHSILNQIGIISTMNSPFIGMLFVYYLFIKRGSDHLAEYITSLSLQPNDNCVLIPIHCHTTAIHK